MHRLFFHLVDNENSMCLATPPEEGNSSVFGSI